jgi:hypothetical protein
VRHDLLYPRFLLLRTLLVGIHWRLHSPCLLLKGQSLANMGQFVTQQRYPTRAGQI